ncbi:MAG: adenosylhomocysteinase [archaeon]
MYYDIKDYQLAKQGKERIEWASNQMPVLNSIKERFIKEQPFKGKKISCCLHVTAKTANLVITLKAGGADVVLCASNPLSTQDDVAAALVVYYNIPVFAIKGENNETYYKHLITAIEHNPQIVVDDGCDLVSNLHKSYVNTYLKDVLGGSEETTTGVVRLKNMEKDGALKFPVVAVNESDTKHLFDNRYGTGQSTLDGIIRATNILLAGKTFVVVGFGFCGKGLALRAKGMGANVIVTEVDHIKAIEASLEGFRVMKMEDAIQEADFVCTVTGNINVVDVQHFSVAKDGCIICNSGHFNNEININALEEMSMSKKTVKEFVDEYKMSNGKKVYILGEGRLVNLACGEGHPPLVMDMSFANQALASEYIVKNYKNLDNKVYTLPEEIDYGIARLKLETMGIEIDTLTFEQIKYLNSWESGT